MAITHLAGAARDGFATVMPGKLWRFDGTFGVTRCSAGWPGTPGMFTDATIPNVRGFLDGKEVPIAVQALRGKHPDGSYRAIGVQVNAVASTLKRAFRLEIWSTARSVGNTLTWIEPTYGLPGGEDATDWPAISYNAVVASTDPEHLCNSYVGLAMLQPAADDSADAKAVYGPDDGDVLKDWLDTLITAGPAATYQSTYEHVVGMYHAYIRTGSGFFFEAGHKWLAIQMSAATYNAGSNYSDVYAQITTADPTIPAPAVDAAGLPNEQNSGTALGWAVGYLLTGWKQPWRQINFKLNWTFSSNELVFSTIYSPRWNIQRNASFALAGYCVEATMQVPSDFGGYGSGRNPSTTTYALQLPSILTECEEWIYASYGSGFADGLVAGLRQTATDDFSSAGRFPVFQLSITARFLIHYYNTIAPDSRIPGWIRTMADVLIEQATIDGTGADWAYELTDTSGGTPTPFADTNYETNYYAEIFGFAYATETNPTTKATYLDWLSRAVRAANYSQFGAATGKAFGQWFGANMQSACYYQSGGQPRGISGVHPTAITEPPLWSS